MISKIIKISFITIAIMVLLVILFFFVLILLGNRPIEDDYYNKVDAVGIHEKKYTVSQNTDVSSIELNSHEKLFKKYKIWYPTDVREQNNKTYPIILFVNGTGFPYKKYGAVFEHLASWGFIVIGNDDANSANGESSSIMLNYITSLNNDKESIFYNKLDLDKIGISGHSQGGVGAINAVTKFDNSNQYTSIYTASTTALELANALEWDYDVTKINIPYFMVAGTGQADAETITPLSSLIDNYNQITTESIKIMARRKNVDHAEMLTHADGYMTAWFRFTLMNDTEAAKVFVGDSPEILINSDNWQDIKIKTY